VGKRIALGLLGLLVAAGVVGAGWAAWRIARAPAPLRGPGTISARPAAPRAAPSTVVAPPADGAGSAGADTILFGDLHVHTTWSIDAFLYALPLFGGEGVHPPADACDFARYCSQLDFFSLNDHAESLFPERWRETIESVRECNARAGDPANPDLVAFVGWEWTQRGATPETHYGHRNVILRGTGDDEVPTRPITALAQGTVQRARGLALLDAASNLGPLGLGPYADLLWLLARIAETPDCPLGVGERELPADCRENAATPAELFARLAGWNLPALVIPHGLAWGVHAPPDARLDTSLANGNHDPRFERLLEVYSGHGNSEQFRAEAERRTDASGEPVCPAPTPGFLACCWRAGEIVRSRCGDLPAAECDARVAEARRLALEAGVHPERVLPDTSPEDWLDCDQCRDCFKPAMSLRPDESAQYALAIRDFTPLDGEPDRFRLGFIASSDDHSARAGTGYKQILRPVMTDARGYESAWLERLAHRATHGTQRDPRRAQPAPPVTERSFGELLDVERGASFFYPGGLVAVHARGRSRAAIWDALEQRDVYGTSGPRILLWFDLVNGPEGRASMGSEVAMRTPPVFEVRAVGARVEQPGCPVESVRALGSERLDRLCRDECHNPGDARHPIVGIEVVRVRPQASPGEPVAPLIEDPWQRLACDPDPAGCVARFEDPEFASAGRDAVYYVRALQEPTPAIDGANLRTTFDAAGEAVAVSPCAAGWRAAPGDDCLAPVQERAWSSPIYVDWDGATAP
jgi:hypothetical protein